jgi:leucyl/phenylalanyl-tRNA---protein transferase
MQSPDWLEQLGAELFGPDFEYAHFPIRNSDRHGLLGFTNKLTPSLVFSAYLQGIFPWYNEDEGDPILWWCPDPRFVLPVDEMHEPKSIHKFLSHSPFEYKMDTAFTEVMRACSEMERPDQNGTWIGEKMIEVYSELASRGIAHSIEAWHDGKLAGGLYGVLIGSIFCGESMFTIEDNSSKSAFILFARAFKKAGGALIDSQVYTANMARYGARNISRDAFLRKENELLGRKLSCPIQIASL